MYRTHDCGQLRIVDIEKQVLLIGWVQKIRDKGSIIWIDLRDRYGITQLVIEEKSTTKEIFEICKKVNKEFVIQVSGIVKQREATNNNLPTGQVEVYIKTITVINQSKKLPFLIEENTDGSEETRMRFRYLDLRRKNMQENLYNKHSLIQLFRDFLNQNNFLEIETPILLKPTPEGAKDFLVPSTKHDNSYYALPQSPQLMKQLLMISGIDRYYQIAKCFRNEELRADRQPEFSQLDCELSFMNQDDIMAIFENLIKEVFIKQLKVQLPDFKRITYEKAMNQYGSDKPDLRYGLEFIDLSDLFIDIGLHFQAKNIIAKAIKIEGLYNYSKKQIEKLKTIITNYNSGNTNIDLKLIYIKYAPDGKISSSIGELLTIEKLNQIISITSSVPSDLIIILAGERHSTLHTMGRLREHFAIELNLITGKSFEPLWVFDFPLFELDPHTMEYCSCHHPFTNPKEDEILLLDIAPEKVKAQSYDLVINGVEVGGGSIRISSKMLQERIFQILGLTKEEYCTNFGFLLEALEFGAPPHGGIAFGIDRLLSVMYDTESIKDFIAFPKRNNGQDLMLNSPSQTL